MQFSQQYAPKIAATEDFPSKSSKSNILRVTSLFSIFYSDLTVIPSAQIPANQEFRIKDLKFF